MPLKPIIRMGDKTSHGGTVLEGFDGLNIYGKPAAGVGHKGSCPLCKCTFTIVEGVHNATFMGKNVAVEGMKTSCGATLIASQAQATIDLAGGDSSPPSVQKISASTMLNSKFRNIAAQTGAASSSLVHPTGPIYDEQFLIKDATGTPLAGVYYTAKLPSGELVHGETDDTGKTQRFATEMAGKIDIYLGHREEV